VLELRNEHAFSRPVLESLLIDKINAVFRARDSTLIVSGQAGIGKSVFWEALLRKRPLHQGVSVWAQLPGPTRVINLLKCKGV